MFKVLLVCISTFVIGCCTGAALFTPCKLGDNACMLSSAQTALSHLAAGIPELGLAPVDPLILADAKSNEKELQLQFKNMQVTGPGKGKFLSVSSSNKNELNFELECPFTATGQYKAGGKLLVLPIEGEGDFEIKTNKIKISIKAAMDIVDGADGKKHWTAKTFDYTYDLPEKVNFKFDNLFGGNQEKAKPVLDILNYSYKEVIDSLGKPVIHEIVQTAKESVIKFLGVVPIEELFVE